MTTQQSRKIEPPKVIGAISKFAGAMVGAAVVTSKRIVKSPAKEIKEPSVKHGKKSVRAPAKKKAVVKTKGRKVKKKTAKKRPARSPAKKSKRRVAVS